jgi:hypothetical protein
MFHFIQVSPSIPTEGMKGHEITKAVVSDKEKMPNREELNAREKKGV